MIDSHGPFASPTQLPAPWAAAPYLLSNHGDSRFHRAWTVPGAFLALTEGTGRQLGLLGLGDAAGVAQMIGSTEVSGAISSLGKLVAAPSDDAASDDATSGDATTDDATRLVPAVVAGTESALDHTPDGRPARAGHRVVHWLTVPRGTLGHSPDLLSGRLDHLGGRGEWDWMWIGAPLRHVDPAHTERLPATPEVAAEVAAFLAVAHPSSDTAADDPRLFAWWAVREDGELRAVVGALRFAPGLAPYLVSLGVHPERRGHGLAGAVLAAAVRDGLAETPRRGGGVSLALYADNHRARRVYLRHGFELHHEFESVRAL